ncbi:ankyrin repeat-containing domain protein [Baffinella frigidus]|nr:ankyrin repeat-containing domain protein [Cryptophyta sp. CCMP2293]
MDPDAGASDEPVLLSSSAPGGSILETWKPGHPAEQVPVSSKPLEDGVLRTRSNMDLLHAARTGDVRHVLILIAEGADVSTKGYRKWTALYWAAENGREELTRVLLDAGADVAAKELSGASPLQFAAGKGREQVVKMLLDTGADVDSGNYDGSTPLHHACASGSAGAVRVLLGAGADVGAKESGGRTPEDLARSQEVRSLLRERWRARHAAFAMGLHPRLGEGAGCLVRSLYPEVLRMVCDAVYGK